MLPKATDNVWYTIAIKKGRIFKSDYALLIQAYRARILVCVMNQFKLRLCLNQTLSQLF